MEKPLKKEKPKGIDIMTVNRTRRFIHIDYHKGDEILAITSNENPLPAFTRALDALVPLVCIIGEMVPEWGATMEVAGLKIGFDRDARTVSIKSYKALSLSRTALTFVTPPALLWAPHGPGPVAPPLTRDQVELVNDVLEQAKRYVRGERAQGIMDLGDDEEDSDAAFDDDDPAQPKLIDVPPSPPPAKPKKGGKK